QVSVRREGSRAEVPSAASRDRGGEASAAAARVFPAPAPGARSGSLPWLRPSRRPCFANERPGKFSRPSIGYRPTMAALLAILLPAGGRLCVRGAGGADKPRYGRLTVCYASSEREAVETAHSWWPNAAIPGQLGQELPLPLHYEQAAQSVAPASTM